MRQNQKEKNLLMCQLLCISIVPFQSVALAILPLVGVRAYNSRFGYAFYTTSPSGRLVLIVSLPLPRLPYFPHQFFALFLPAMLDHSAK